MTDTSKMTPKSDVIFKILFGDPKHSRILIHFLNSVVKSNSPIIEATVEQTELTPEYVGDKMSRLDILAKTENGELINVEIQRKDEKNMQARSLFYWSRIFAGQAVINDKYQDLKRTICINILDFTLFKDERYWRTNFIKDNETNEKLSDLLEIHFLELNKMKQIEKESPITFWIEFLKNPDSEEVKKICEFVPEIREVKDLFEKAKSDPAAKELYRLREKGVRDYANDMAVAKDAGLAEGKELGKEDGKKEKAIEMAKKMLLKGLDVDDIAEISGLSISEIEILR